MKQRIKELMAVNREQSTTTETPVKPQPMLGGQEILAKYPSFQMERARMEGNRLLFDNPDGIMRALATGFFCVEIPSLFDLAAGDLFVRNFFEEPLGDDWDPYRGFKKVTLSGEYEGYTDDPDEQWEIFNVEMRSWDAILPDKVARLGYQMTDLGISILHNVLEYIAIQRSEWEKVTNGLSEKRGCHSFGFNHYRSEKNCRGVCFHRDTGWVTVLRSTEPGLLAVVGDELFRIDPVPGHFTINFGSTIELLTERLVTPVHASIHGVVRTQQSAKQSDRTSYALFLDSHEAGWVYRYENARPLPIETVAKFWQDDLSRVFAEYDPYLSYALP